MSICIEKAQRDAAFLFLEQGSLSPQIDAAVLLCHVLDKPSSYLYTWPEKCLSDDEMAAYQAVVDRRKEGEPVAYIIGYRDFWSLRLRVEPCTLIPRPDTECLVEFALARLPQGTGVLLDLGTGTGAIALAVAKERPDIEVIGVDLRPEAVALAQRNGLENGIANARFIQSSWFEGLLGQTFSMIVSNPPYIDSADPHLLQGDVRFEPQAALVAGDHGLADIRHICQQSIHYLDDKGWLLIEHGYRQASVVRRMFSDMGLREVETLKDYSGHDRVTLGRFVR